MKAEKILFIDTETGGLDPTENSLLSIAFVVWQDFKIIGSKEILINDGVLKVSEEALKINGIDLIKHLKHALKPQFAINEMVDFLNHHFERDEKVTLGGHNINFDVNFMKAFLTNNNYNFNKKFSHRVVDTASILTYLYLGGKIKQKVVSSSEAFNFFGIPVYGRHTALGDAIATAKLFTVLLNIITTNNTKASNLLSLAI